MYHRTTRQFIHLKFLTSIVTLWHIKDDFLKIWVLLKRPPSDLSQKVLTQENKQITATSNTFDLITMAVYKVQNANIKFLMKNDISLYLRHPSFYK